MTITNSTIDPARTDPALQSIAMAYTTSVLHPAVVEAFQALGLDAHHVGDVNLLTRCAAMRTFSPAVVWSAFFNPNPESIDRLIPASFEIASFDAILNAQTAALDEPFAKAASLMDPAELRELASLCRTATTTAMQQCEGRPLFAGLASLPLPTEDHLMMWHAARLLASIGATATSPRS